MKSAGWYFMQGGRRVWAATKAEISRLARQVADDLGKPVTVRPAAAGGPRKITARRNPAPAHRPPAATLTTFNEGRSAWRRGWGLADNPYQSADLRQAWIKGWRHARDKGGKRTMRANPDPGAFVDVWSQQERGKAARREYVKATKGRRLAKSLGRRGGQVEEAAKAKTAKFAVSAKNRREAFTLYRPSRSAADRLASEFTAAGYTVVVREI